jgi:hypothetical protein
MKKALLVLLAFLSLVACETQTDSSSKAANLGNTENDDEQSNSSEGSVESPYRFCGLIYRHNENGLSSADNVVRLIYDECPSDDFDDFNGGSDCLKEFNLWPNNPQVEAALDLIRGGKTVEGCVTGPVPPAQGFEGIYFRTDSISAN